MRWLVALPILLAMLGGCISDEPTLEANLDFPLDVYRFHYAGSDTFVEGTDHGWLISVNNPSDEPYRVSILPLDVESGLIGPIAGTGGVAPQTTWLPGRIENAQVGQSLYLAPDESGLFLARIEAYARPVAQEPTFLNEIRIFAAPTGNPDVVISRSMSWTINTKAGSDRAVMPGDHVQTVTVGVWLNGTSFYSNAEGALTDPGFPHGEGWTSPDDDTTPLPIYVYDNSRDEQPPGSRDSCHFTTINGYNGLLKLQSVGSTNVAYLRPDAAYTSAGNEAHPLYGDALVFMNTVVARDTPPSTTDAVPNPQGACFEDRINDTMDMLPIPGLTRF